MAQGGNKNSGRKNLGVEYQMIQNYNKFSPIFWAELEKFFKSDMVTDRKFAITTFNKIQVKMIPQKLSNAEDDELNIKINYGKESLDKIDEIITKRLNGSTI